MKKILSIVASAMFLFGASAQAQEVEYEAGHNFITLQGGAQATLTHYNFLDLVTPQYALSFGRYFNDKVGARLHVQGYEINGGFKADRFPGLAADTKYAFKDITGDLDLLVNMSNVLFPNRTNHTWDWVLLAGFGANVAWECQKEFSDVTVGKDWYHGPMQNDDRFSTFNGRVGTQVQCNLTKNFAISLEADANYKNDQFNFKYNGQNDWQVAAFLGFTYKFGVKTKKAVELPEIWETRVDTIWYDDTEYKTKTVTEQFTCDDHFQIRQSLPVSESVVNKVADFVKTYKNVKVNVTGYADKGTGNPRVNQMYSQQRAESVTKALVEAGIPSEIITTDWKGDTVQPFAENDENRAAIVTVSGETEQKYPVTVKKFRTEETRYRVQ